MRGGNRGVSPGPGRGELDGGVTVPSLSPAAPGAQHGGPGPRPGPGADDIQRGGRGDREGGRAAPAHAAALTPLPGPGAPRRAPARGRGGRVHAGPEAGAAQGDEGAPLLRQTGSTSQRCSWGGCLLSPPRVSPHSPPAAPADIERYSDKYQLSSPVDSAIDWNPDWRRLPRELKIRVRRLRKGNPGEEGGGGDIRGGRGEGGGRRGEGGGGGGVR
ncbi:DNA-directed RNA polymerase III subunit RPC7-like isoform 7-T7 [Cyanocitta cristata]